MVWELWVSTEHWPCVQEAWVPAQVSGAGVVLTVLGEVKLDCELIHLKVQLLKWGFMTLNA